MPVDVPVTSLARGPRGHDIGRGGVVVISGDACDVRVRGVDGTEARVVAPADGAGLETTAEPGRFTIRTAGSLTGAFLGLRIGGHGFGIRVSGTVEIDVPRDARVEIGTTAGDVVLRGVVGGVTVRTASGDVEMSGLGGSVSASVASGDVTLTGDRPISVEARSASGDIRARAPSFERVSIETISGDAELTGAFAPGVRHAISTVSGEVELALVGGVQLEVRTVSGDVSCRHPDRRAGDGRSRPLVIGDGVARLAVRTMSGDVAVRAATRVAEPATAGEPTTAAEPTAASAPAVEPMTASPQASPVEPAAPVVTPAVGVERADMDAVRPAAPEEEETRVAPPWESARADAAHLSILEALSRGEIDVPEAERRLATTGRPPTATAAAPDEAARDG